MYIMVLWVVTPCILLRGFQHIASVFLVRVSTIDRSVRCPITPFILIEHVICSYDFKLHVDLDHLPEGVSSQHEILYTPGFRFLHSVFSILIIDPRTGFGCGLSSFGGTFR
jgi:hypothetical protein